MMNIILKTVKGGQVTNFERFKQKSIAGVLNAYKGQFSPCDFGGFFFRDYREADYIAIYATPDHYNTGAELARFAPREFFEAISR